MTSSVRPSQATLFTALLLASSLLMAYAGSMAVGYFVPAVCLLLQAVLLWQGKAFKFFEWVMVR